MLLLALALDTPPHVGDRVNICRFVGDSQNEASSQKRETVLVLLPSSTLNPSRPPNPCVSYRMSFPACRGSGTALPESPVDQVGNGWR